MSYEPHPLADLFPLMGEVEFADLVADVRKHGLRDPIVLLGGKVLDGRNRLRACDRAGVTPRFEEFAGDDPLAFVLSKNLHRRHLSESQRGMVAARLHNMKSGHRSDCEPSRNYDEVPPPVSSEEAAKLLNVHRATVFKAKSVEKNGVPELAEQVRTGDVSLHAAAEVAKLPVAEQEAVVTQGPAAVKRKAAEMRAKPEAEPIEVDDAASGEPEPELPARPAAKPKHLRGVGVFQANAALNALHKIPDSDPEMGQAIRIISAWVAKHRQGRHAP